MWSRWSHNLLHSSFKRQSTRMNLWCFQWRIDACPLPLSKREQTTWASFFVTKRLYKAMSTTWWMLSGKKKGFSATEGKHRFITWPILTLIIQFIESLTFEILLNVIHTSSYLKCYAYSLWHHLKCIFLKHCHEVEDKECTKESIFKIWNSVLYN